jgi:hypothetical protein
MASRFCRFNRRLDLMLASLVEALANSFTTALATSGNAPGSDTVGADGWSPTCSALRTRTVDGNRSRRVPPIGLGSVQEIASPAGANGRHDAPCVWSGGGGDTAAGSSARSAGSCRAARRPR